MSRTFEVEIFATRTADGAGWLLVLRKGSIFPASQQLYGWSLVGSATVPGSRAAGLNIDHYREEIEETGFIVLRDEGDPDAA